MSRFLPLLACLCWAAAAIFAVLWAFNSGARATNDAEAFWILAGLGALAAMNGEDS